MLLFTSILSLFIQDVVAQEAKTEVPVRSGCYVETQITGVIGPATLDLLERAEHLLQDQSCKANLLLINTPGGNLQTTRIIVEKILNSDFPYLCYVYPAGAHAGSAGAIILQACHLAGAIHTTNIGAASPISGTGENIPEDLRKKIFNDTKSWVESLAKLRNRDVNFAKDIIEEAKAVSADEALKLKAIEFVGNNKEEFLIFARTFDFKIGDKATFKLDLKNEVVMPIDFRYRVMDILMNPTIAYLILMGSLGLLYFELTHPGFIAPGVIGGIGLIISLISMHILEVKWGAFALIIAGIGFLIAEAFVAGFGILGAGGVIAFLLGSLFLFDPVETGFVLPLSIIIPTTLIMGGLMLFVAYMAFSTRKKRPKGGQNDLVDHVGAVTRVEQDNSKHGYMEISGEIWRVISDEDLTVGQTVRVSRVEGLTLIVKNQSS